MAIRLVLIGGDAWRESASPWLRGVEAWRDARPSVVLTPDRAQGFYLRSRLVTEKQAAFGIHFWTPSDAREFLRGAVCPQLRAATQNDQALIARACAEKLLRGKPGPDDATLRSVAQDPRPFLRGHDLLLGAGWNASRDGANYGKRMAAEFESTLRKAGLLTQAGLHRELRMAKTPKLKPMARVLITGFNAAHWPLWDLLQAVCRMTDEVEVALDHPAEFGRGLDELWVNSWESFAGTGYEIGDEPQFRPLEPLAKSYEEGSAAPVKGLDIHFLATATLGEQVRAVTLQALEYLRRPECNRLGLVFPEADALALGVAAQLRELRVPVNDSLGALQPGLFETRPWQSWLDLQEEPTVRRLIAWLRACDAAQRGTGLVSIPARDAADCLDYALGESMVDHLDFIADHLDPRRTEERTIADFLRKRMVLPEQGTVAGHLTATREALRRLKWDDLLALLPEQAPTGTGDLAISRRGFLAWLREVTVSQERVRPDGNHFYGKVHLVVYSQIAGQEWSHLILTGLNEGEWPRLFEAGASGSRYELAELNAKARALNESSARQGEQGVGQEIVAPGRGHCLLPTERHDLALRDLCSVLRAMRGSVCLAARTTEQGRNLLPSDFFSHAWQVETGRVLGEPGFRELARKTSERCREHAAFFAPKPEEPQDIEATAKAHAVRQDPEVPFDRHQFAYAQAPESPIQLSCKDWQRAFNDPASAWLDLIVGAGAWPEGNLSWKLSQGTWTHRWLYLALNEGAKADDLEKRVQAAAERDWKAVEKRSRDTGVALYPWWRQLWSQSAATARALARQLAPQLAGKRPLAEFRLPRPLEIALPGASRADFNARGRLDVVLVETTEEISAEAPNFAGVNAWVIDFKTGHDKSLTESQLKKGNGLQIALYGLALRKLGAASVNMSILTPRSPLKQQLTEEKVAAMAEPFTRLESMHRQGIFGESAEDREHGHAPAFPMTTRPVPREVLQAKWEIEKQGGSA